MKKTIIALMLVLTMIALPITCLASNSTDVNTADALNDLGLFLGTGNGYDLENGLTRAQGITLLVRMIGMEETAKNGVYENSFTDVPEWAAGYIGYAFENGITSGTGETTFSPDAEMTDYMFLTLVLRALGYSDSGETPLFVWNDPYALAHELNMIESDDHDAEFTRADAIKAFWNALDVNVNGTEVTLADQLVSQGVFTADELANAREIQENGRQENAGVPVIPTPETDATETDATETDATETDAPETDAPETDATETDATETDATETDATETDPNPDEEDEGAERDPRDENVGEEDIF